MKQREERVPAMVPARLRSASGWQDATITNLSERGLCLRSPEAPERGHFLELRRGSHVIVARVVWSAEGKCGVRTQEPLPVFDIINDRPAGRRRFGLPVVERRRDRSRLPGWQRLAGKKMEYIAIGVVGTLAAVGMGQAVFTALSAPLDLVEAALVSGP